MHLLGTSCFKLIYGNILSGLENYIVLINYFLECNLLVHYLRFFPLFFCSLLFSQFKSDESVDGNPSESTESTLLSVLHYFKNCSNPQINSVYAQISDQLNSCKLWRTLENFKNESELIVCLNDQPYLGGAIMLQNVGILSSVMEVCFFFFK